MSLDDRLRAAYDRQLDDVRRRVDGAEFRPPAPTARPSLGSRALAVAAALALVGAGAAAVLRLAGGASTPVTTDPAAVGSTDDGDGNDGHGDDEDGGDGASDGSGDPAVDDAAVDDRATGQSGVGQAATATSDPTSTPDPDRGPATGSPDQEGAGPTDPDPGDDSAPALDPGVASDVCPSGVRAALERATTSYIGEGRGWGRKDDLVDEQDGPFYFVAWEPGYEGPVAVEVRLDRPVRATEIRVAQDPYTEVSGAIGITIDETRERIELEGVGGWRTLALDPARTIDSFVIDRDDAQANVMEVLVCVEGAGS